MTGTILVAAVYGLLDMQYRTSRALIVMSAFWAAIAMMGVRVIIHFIKFGNINLSNNTQKNIIIIGDNAEVERVKSLLQQALFNYNLIGTIHPKQKNESNLSDLEHLEEVINIYNVNEIIFCAKDITAETIMYWMNCLVNKVTFRILPESSSSIIGSSSKDSNGELFTIEINYKIAQKDSKRNKRLLDVFVALLFLLFFPILIFIVPNQLGFLKNILLVLIGKKTWVGYIDPEKSTTSLPMIRFGVLSKAALLNSKNIDAATKQRINFFYAKDYDYTDDLSVIWKGRYLLGNQNENPIKKL